MLAGVERLGTDWLQASLWDSQGTTGFMGVSLEYRTVSAGILRRFNSRRMTLHRGQTEVLLMSVISNNSGCSLLPVPMDEIRGILWA